MKNTFAVHGRVNALFVSLLLLPALSGRIANLRADVANEVTVVLRPGLPETSERKIILHAFGGTTLKFQTMVEASLGTRLSLHADLVQTASGVGVTILKDVLVSTELVFDGRTFLTAECALPALPVVERLTRMRLLLRKAGTDRPSLPPTSLEVWVYPVENPDVWKKMIAARLTGSGLDRLEIFGQGKSLRQFLRDRQVDFEDGSEEWPAELKAHTFYVAETPLPIPSHLASTAGARLALIPPPGFSTLLPGIYREMDPQGGNTVKVTLPDMLEHLADNPRSQQTLAEIFRLALEPSPSTDPSNPNLSRSP